MPRYFSSVLRILSGDEQQQSGENSTLTICGDGKSVSLPKEHAEKPFKFDRVYFAADDNTAVYKGSIKEIVEGSLLGYHGTIISTGEQGLECGDTLSCSNKRSPGAILKAADHVFVCIKRSRTRAGSSLVVLCSYVAIIDEKVYDLLRNYGNSESTSGDFPQVSCKQGQLSGQTAFTAKNSVAVLKFLNHGEGALNELNEKLEKNLLWHTIFTITVEHAQFGAQFAPVSGILSFVQLSASQQGKPSNCNSYGNFISVIDQLANMKLDLKSVSKQPDYHKSVLTEILRESLGGNCRTVLVTHVNFVIQHPDRALTVLGVGSKACAVHNQPNKRDLAEQALMSAYMKELRQIYGNVSVVEEKPLENKRLKLPFVTDSLDLSVKPDASQTSVLTTEIDDTYEELLKDLNTGKGGTAPKRFVEMAANALAEAALEGDESCSDNDDDTEEDTSNVNLATEEEPCSSKSLNGGPKKDKGKAKRQKSEDSASTTSKDSDPTTGDALMLSLPLQGFAESDMNVYKALAAILQDPDRGAHRVQDRKNIKIRKDVGALFSGANIVQWMIDNLDGLTTSAEAEKLGQLLLDQDAILHSEGSRIFANAQSLFYYVQRPRAAGKMLSREQVAVLLAQAEGRDRSHVTDVIPGIPPNNITAVSVVSPVVKHERNKADSERSTHSMERPVSGGKRISMVEVLTEGGNIFSGKTCRRDVVAVDVVALSTESVQEEVDQAIQNHVIQQKDCVVDAQAHVIQQQELEKGTNLPDQQLEIVDYQPEEVTGDDLVKQQESLVQQQVMDHMIKQEMYHVTEQELNQHESVVQQQEVDRAAELEAGHLTMHPRSNSNITAAPPTAHTSTSDVGNAKYASQTSMLNELRLTAKGPSISSVQCTAKRGGAGPWSRSKREGNGWFDDDYNTSMSSGLHLLQPHDEVDSLPDDQRSYLDVPNVAMTTESAEIEDFDNVEDYPTPLHMSAALGKREGVIANLSMMYAVDNEDSNGRTPLMYATIKNKAQTCQALIACGAKVDKADYMGTTALHYAACLGYCNVISLLLSKGATPLLKDNQGQTALHLATVPATTAAVHIILRSTEVRLITEEDNHKLTPIHWTIAFDHTQQLKLMIKSIGDPSNPDSCGRSLLNYSICCNSVNCTRLLTSLYPLLMGVADSNGFFPAHVASMQESATPLTILLQADAANAIKRKKLLDLNATDDQGKTALHWSTLYNRKDTTELLLKQGASKDVRDQEGLTPLDIAQRNENDVIISLLQQEEIKTSAQNEENVVRRTGISRFCILL